MIQAGNPARLGARWDGEGVSFALYSSGAEAVDLCLFDEPGRETGRFELPSQDDNVWHGYLPACEPGQRYGYRVHGRYAPAEGLRFNANKLLIDPYARALDGGFSWSPAVFDFDPEGHGDALQLSALDSAPFVPKCVVTAPREWQASRPNIPWSKTIIYEANVRGFTMRHPAVPDADRGKFSGMRNSGILDYLKALGITSIELMPVHAFIDEAFLEKRGLRNFWGYNSINYFVPEARYAGSDARGEFRDMVNAIHDAGIEVILDVVYNHTGESDERGPTLSFRGIDNLAYYRTLPGDPGAYVNNTGCGNTLNVDHPRVRELVLASLRYWHREMGVDGFRFDLAPVLGRSADGFDSGHALLTQIGSDPVLNRVKLIAEPWDAGPGGYQLGHFPSAWTEWNDRYRDSVRRFWRGDPGQAGEFARRIHGSADIFESSGRTPHASINHVTSHDGYTLADVVSYQSRKNLANGEGNQDGHAHNFSRNYGVEGETGDEPINHLRRRQRLNMLATLLMSQGTPMLLAGDEFGNSQLGNNNAYAQDNGIGWLDWHALDADPGFWNQVRDLIRLRREIALLRPNRYLHGDLRSGSAWPDIEWLHPHGRKMEPADWLEAQAFTVFLAGPGRGQGADWQTTALAITFNASGRTVEFTLPAAPQPGAWELAFASSGTLPPQSGAKTFQLRELSIASLRNIRA